MKKMILCFLAGVSLLCSACGDGEDVALDLTAKDEKALLANFQQVTEDISKVSIYNMGEGNMVKVDMLGGDIDPLLMSSSKIKSLLQAITKGKGNDTVYAALLFLHQTGVDRFGNREPVLAMKLEWPIGILRQVNWENITGAQLINLATINDLKPFGRHAVREYCKDGADSYAAEFCRKAGWR